MAEVSTNYSSGDDYTLEFLGYRFSFGAQDFEVRALGGGHALEPEKRGRTRPR